MNRALIAPALFGGGLVLSYALLTAQAEPEKVPAPVSEKLQPFAKQILEVARTYPKYGRVDDEFRWAPWLCRMPNPGTVRFTESKDEDTHGGRKLYSIFAKDRDSYSKLSYSQKPMDNAPGQIIVKESWLPEEVKDRKIPHPVQQTRKLENGMQVFESFLPYASRDGKVYKASK
ncbi:MAG TPA: hypothetical protein VGZ47_09900, partial [Gemmataceae bacterium]|nr:hypothetical protein [Gemmataceae bacterium]